MTLGRKTDGRKKGTPNKVTADIKALAQKHGAEAIEGLLELARSAESEQTRHAAWNSLLDRGYGRSAQVVKGDGDGTLPISVIHRVIIAGELPKPDDVEAEYSVVNDENATPTATQPDNEDDDASVINWLVDEGN